MATSAVFDDLYRKLDAKQREAADAIEGPVMVIAGPGTGKTSILTLRIANILHLTDTPADAILALTFTESAVQAMRGKLVWIIGPTAYRVGIYTFHSFSNELIQTYPEAFPRIVGGRPAGTIDQVHILEKIFTHEKLTILRPFGDMFFYLPRVLDAIKTLKRDNILPAHFEKLVRAETRSFSRLPDRYHTAGAFSGEMKATYRDRERKLRKNRELLTIYRAYEAALRRQRLYDYEDMILEVIGALERDVDLLRTLQERYHYILADEHQDANFAQNRILELLAAFHEHPNLFIVGDEKQAIYRFQGASLDNFLYFNRLYPDVKLITLTENYRSTQMILDAAHSLMSRGSSPAELPAEILRPRLSAQERGAHGNIRFLEFETEEEELFFVASDIEKKRREGVPLHEVAVLYRDNRDAIPLVRALQKTNLPFLVLSEEPLLDDPEMEKLLLILRAVAAPGDEARFSSMLHVDFLGIKPIDLYTVLAAARQRRQSLFKVLRDPARVRALGVSDPACFTRLLRQFERWAQIAANQPLVDAVEYIIFDAGFIAHLLSSGGSLNILERLDAFFSYLKEIAEGRGEMRLAEFLNFLELLKRHGLHVKRGAPRQTGNNAIHLMTVHRAKGLEFPSVYLIRAIDGHWGNRTQPHDFLLPLERIPPGAVGRSAARGKERAGRIRTTLQYEQIEDERRLFYVAVTRAKNEVTVTMARQTEKGKPALPTQFISEIDATLLARIPTSLSAAELSQKKWSLSPRTPRGPSLADQEHLRMLFLEQGLNVTALNNYRQCPWKYFFKNLIRLPEAPEKHQRYGTAVHEALRDFFEQRRRGRRPSKHTLISFFKRALDRQPFEERDFNEVLSRGQTALSGYYDAYRRQWPRNVLSEVKIAGVFVPITPEVKLLLRGVLDRIERNADGEVNVVDAKTGKPQSRRHILGETKSSEGNMKRQLDFYKLLLDDYEDGKWKMISGEIDFVEPDLRGRYHREKFFVGEEDAHRARELVRQVGLEILSLSFWDRRCDDRGCQFCRLRETMGEGNSRGGPQWLP